MTLTKSSPHAKRRWALLIGSVAVMTLLLAGVAFAVHDLVFQLDGDTSTARGTTPTTAQIYDWDSIFTTTASGGVTGTSSLVNATNNPGFTNAAFVRDFGVKVSATDKCNFANTTSLVFCTADPSTYATGSKDTLGIGNGGWQCNVDNNVNSKIDIMNAYAAAYTASNGHKILYFGLDKNKDNGDNNVGFWFLQGSAGCTSTGPAVDFTGGHRDGDILVTSEFTKGGGVSGITVFRWAAAASGPLSGDGGCIDSNDNPDPHAGGCNQLAIGSGGDCKTAASDDSICATTNSGTLAFNGNITTKWLTADATLGVGNTVVPPDFFEGGIDLTSTFAQAGSSAPSCFNTFVGDTRSSQQPTATLFDYALGVLGECKTALATQQNFGSVSQQIGTNGTISSGTDTATLTITGSSTWGGTLNFYLCGPDVTSCDTHGVLVTSKTVSSGDNTTTYTSDTATLTSAGGTTNPGQYCWHASFTPDTASANAGIKSAADNGTNECFTVTPRTPTLSTAATCTSTPCVLGTDTLSDTATLSGTANNPKNDGAGGDTGLYKSINGTTTAAGGSISWTLYGPGTGGVAQCTTAITGAPTPSSVTVSGDSNPTYGPVTYKPALTDGVGKYTFAASYPGSGPNTNAASAVTCANGATDGEQITVTGSASSASKQRWLPNDRVVLTTTGGTTLNGTLTVTLYADASCGATPGTSADAVAGQQYTFTPSGAASGSVFQTTNTTYFVGTNPNGTAGGAAGSYSWLVHYHDNNLTSPSDQCETSTVSPITDAP